MAFIDLQGRFLKIRNPQEMSLWMRIRLTIACWFYPPFKQRKDDWAANYFNSQYMIAVHRFYEGELRQLNKAVVKKGNKVKELQRLLKEKDHE